MAWRDATSRKVRLLPIIVFLNYIWSDQFFTSSKWTRRGIQSWNSWNQKKHQTNLPEKDHIKNCDNCDSCDDDEEEENNDRTWWWRRRWRRRCHCAITGSMMNPVQYVLVEMSLRHDTTQPQNTVDGITPAPPGMFFSHGINYIASGAWCFHRQHGVPRWF